MYINCALRVHVQRIFSMTFSRKKNHECRDRKRYGGWQNLLLQITNF